MTKWHESALCGFDYETTAPDPTIALPVQVGVSMTIVVDGKEEWLDQSYEEIVNPGVEIKNSEIHGITTEIAERDGSNALDSFIRLRAHMLRMVERRVPIVMFNAAYDWTLFKAEHARYNNDFSAFNTARILDPLVIDRKVDKYVKGKGQRQQGNVAKRYGIAVKDELHSGGYDAYLATQIARAQGRKYPWLSQNLQYQEDWAREQQADLQAYFNSQNRGITIDTGWPVRDPVDESDLEPLDEGWTKPAAAYDVKDSM